MTDQTTLADKVRTILDEWERIKEHADWDDIDNLVQDVRALLPTPPRPTLADMTEEERDACQWMQADTKLWGRVVIIVPDLSDGRAALLDRSGDVIYGRYVNVTPRPDLPRVEWPGDTPTAPDHLAVGSEWDDLDALARACDESGRNQIAMVDKDGDVFVWGADEGWWETGLPGRDYAPFTIIYTGKKTDQ